MREYKHKYLLFFFLLLGIISTSIGFSSWIATVDEFSTDNTILANTSAQAVCYDASSKTKYTSIEKALSVAKADPSENTIYVIPGRNPTLRINAEVAVGDTFCLPFNDNGNDVHDFLFKEDRQPGSGITFGDLNETNVNNNRKSLLTINKDVQLINNGTITVGGSLGPGGADQGITGQTATKYAEILMRENASIINNGRLNVYGYIKESAKNNGSMVDQKSGSITYAPLVIYDFRGGSYSKACSTINVLPFSNFDLPNCQVLQRFNYGAKFYGMANVYAGSTFTYSDSMVLGTANDKTLFQLRGGYMDYKYTPSNPLYTTNDVVAATTEETANYTTIKINGDLDLSSLSIDVGVKIDTKTYFCPLSYKFQIIVESGVVNVNNMMKFLGGSLIHVKENGRLNFNADVSFYQNYIPNITTWASNVYPQSFKTSKLINDGTVAINNKFGGMVETTLNTGKLITSGSFVNQVNTQEVLTSKGSSIFATPDLVEDHNEQAVAFFESPATPEVTPTAINASKTYKSNGDYWSEFKELDIQTASLNIPSGQSNPNEAKAYNLSVSLDPIDYQSTNVNYAWSCNPSDATLTNTTGPTTQLTTPANGGSADTIYTVECVVSFTKTDGTPGQVKALGSYTALKPEDPCLAKGADILMADDSIKKVEDVKPGDLVKVFNHETGQIDISPIIYVTHADEGAKNATTIELKFENNYSLKIVKDHALFDKTTNQYEVINAFNCNDFIGHEFAIIDNNSIKSVKLQSAIVRNEILNVYCPVSAVHLNLFANNLLTVTTFPNDIRGLYNIFELDEDMKYNEEKKNADIEKYGLFTYEEFIEIIYISEDAFNVSPAKYLKVSLGKGLITEEQIIEGIKYLLNNNLIDN